MTLSTDLTSCDLEPIHIPGSIQPYGLMLVTDAATLSVSHVAGDVEGRLGCIDWCNTALQSLIGAPLAERAATLVSTRGGGLLGQFRTSAELFDVSAHLSGRYLIVELEPASSVVVSAVEALGTLEAAAANFARANSLIDMCEQAAVDFRRLTGFDRVMIYRFLDDDAGQVIAEDRRADLPSFLNHHFPASDIPRQARVLYIRNLTRVIPDITYQPAILRPDWSDTEPLNLSDSVLRSVSPIHLRYLANMGVAASASISIVKDGVLWGLIAFHNYAPLRMSYEVRASCRTLVGDLARQIRAKDEADGYRERIRLISFEDRIVDFLSRENLDDDDLRRHIGDIRLMFDGDGAAIYRDGNLIKAGACPQDSQIKDLAAWLLEQDGSSIFATDRLSKIYTAGAAFTNRGSGVLAVTISKDEAWVLLWFRAEQIEVVNWAGNPHKPTLDADQLLTPRSSFAAWRETVRGRARRWTMPEIEAADRIRATTREFRRHHRTEELNRQLMNTLRDKEQLLQQNAFLIGEIDHRVQNSLMLVSSFLALQGRNLPEPSARDAIQHARRRISAVGLVHRRLYRSDQMQNVDAGRYIAELCQDMITFIGTEWVDHFTLDLAPVIIPTDRVITLGLVLTELLINANKYAYGGAPGPIAIQLSEDRAVFRLIVADQGVGISSESNQGFGSRILRALVSQLGAELTYSDNEPGLRATLTAPTQDPRRLAG